MPPLKKLLAAGVASLALSCCLACEPPQDSGFGPSAATSPSAASDSILSDSSLTPNVRSAESSLDATTFSVMSWNLEWFYDEHGGDNYSKLAREKTAPSRAQWDWRRDQVAASLGRVRPSVIALQEIENKRVLWYLTRALARNHELDYQELCVEGDDVFTEQDVGFLYRPRSETKKPGSPRLVIQPTWVGTFGRTAAMLKDDSLAEVSKHLAVQYELSLGDQTESVTVVTLHLRAKEEAVSIRTKQARTIHTWIADKIRAGENVIVLGDFNTEESSFPAASGTDMHAACGLDTRDVADDLVDLHGHLPEKQRQTHLLAGKSFDRILVSRSMLEDHPDRADLSLEQIECLKDLSIKGSVDMPAEHWDKYWQIHEADRDLSDHWPVMATFKFR